MANKVAKKSGNKPQNWRCTLAVAADSPWCALAVGYSGRLSRLYLLDLRSDTLIPGQFVGGRADILAISPDGQYIGYYCENFRTKPSGWIAVSRAPYATALAWWGTSHCTWADVAFVGSQLHVLSFEWWGGGGPCPARDYVKEDCPFEIVNAKTLIGGTGRGANSAHDHVNSRELVFKDGVLFADVEPLMTFKAETFEEIETPTWASQWRLSRSDTAARKAFLAQ